ncbi:MAG: restriction endonuclease subunit S [Anaerolineales bacterium]|nr:restriction endonuclease subunit S [Anaerolineales bacterium]
MIHDLKPYPAMKDSDVPWLGNVPEHWSKCPGFAAFREKQVKNTGMREKTVLSLSYGRIVVKPPEKLHGLVPESFETYQIVEPGDIIIRSTDLQNDWNSLRVGLVRDRGIITSAYLCFKTTDMLIPEYGYLLLHALDLMKIFYGLGSGLRQNLSFLDFKRMVIFVPPVSEQSAIVRFLDAQDRRISRLIRDKRRLVELLNEKKQVIINHAVTKGLDPDVPMKDSRVKLMGEVPDHWGFTDLKRICLKVTDGSHFSPPTQDTGLPYITVKDVKERGIDFENCKRISEEEYLKLKKNGCQPRSGDVLLTKDGTIGKAVVINEDKNFVILSSLGLITPNQSKIISEYLRYYLISGINVDQMFSFIQGSALTRLTITLINQLLIVYPPIPEQHTIVSFLDHETAKLDALIAITRREIDLVREFRTRLISDVVTGKLDVRGVELPAIDEVETLGEIDTGEYIETEAEELIESEEVADADE